MTSAWSCLMPYPQYSTLHYQAPCSTRGPHSSKLSTTLPRPSCEASRSGVAAFKRRDGLICKKVMKSATQVTTVMRVGIFRNLEHVSIQRGGFAVAVSKGAKKFYKWPFQDSTPDKRNRKTQICTIPCFIAVPMSFKLRSMFPQKMNGHGFLLREYISDHAQPQEGPPCLPLMVPPWQG